MEARQGVHAALAHFQVIKFGRRDQSGLVEQDDVGKRNLFTQLAAILQMQPDVLGVHLDDGDDAIKAQGVTPPVIYEKKFAIQALDWPYL